MSHVELEAFIQRWLAAWTGNQPERLLTFYAPDATEILPPRVGKSETIELFNGKNLDGWEGHQQLWSVRDGVIVARKSSTGPIRSRSACSRVRSGCSCIPTKCRKRFTSKTWC